MMEKQITMETIWRFFSEGISGIVVASNKEQAIERADEYISGHFPNDIHLLGKMQVWKCIDDDDFNKNYPNAIAISY